MPVTSVTTVPVGPDLRGLGQSSNLPWLEHERGSGMSSDHQRFLSTRCPRGSVPVFSLPRSERNSAKHVAHVRSAAGPRALARGRDGAGVLVSTR